MWCKTCAYYVKPASPSVCRTCGRYLPNKYGQLIVIAAATLSLSVFSSYLLTGQLWGGNRLIWVKTALSAPYSIYMSQAYAVAAAAALAGLAALPVLAAYHYGMGWGLVLAVAEGLLSGVHGGVIMFPAAAAVAATGRYKRVPAAAWPVVAALLCGLCYIGLGWKHGPQDSLYSDALLAFLMQTTVLAATIAAVVALLGVLLKQNSLPAAALLAAVACVPVAVFFRWVGPSRLQANMVVATNDPRMLSGELPAGFASITPVSLEGGASGRQLRNLIDVYRYVDALRAKALRAADDYLARYPLSADAADIMLFKTRMLDLRVDTEALRRHDRLETYSDRVSEWSVPVYEDVVKRFARTPEAAIAAYRLAEEALGAGRLVEAHKLFAEAEAALAEFVPATYAPEPLEAPKSARDLFDARRQRENARLDAMHRALVATRRRLALIRDNSDFGGQPLARFAALDPRGESFDVEAARLLTEYRDAKVADNVKLALAERLTDTIARRAALEALLAEHERGDARDRALLLAARAQMATNIDGQGLLRAELHIRRLLADYPQSTYRGEAQALLARIMSSATGRPVASAD